MMEMKYRIWQDDTEVKRMLYPKDMVDYCELVFIPNPVGSMRPFCHASQPCYVAPQNFVVMLSTGFLDQKKTEIFDQDIIYFAVYKAYGVVEWNIEYGCWWVRLVDRPPLHKQDGSLFDFLTSIGWGDIYEVVGNRYSTPELLEAKK